MMDPGEIEAPTGSDLEFVGLRQGSRRFTRMESPWSPGSGPQRVDSARQDDRLGERKRNTGDLIRAPSANTPGVGSAYGSALDEALAWMETRPFRNALAALPAHADCGRSCISERGPLEAVLFFRLGLVVRARGPGREVRISE